MSGLRAASIEERLVEVSRISARWLKKTDPHRRAGVRALVSQNGYPRAMAEAILDNLFAKFTGDFAPHALRAVRKLHRSADVRTGMVFPSNVPDPVVVNIFLSLIAGCPVTARFSKSSSAFGRVFLKSLEKSRIFKGDVTAVAGRAAFFKRTAACDLVVAFGGDEAVEEIRKRSAARRFAGYGHRFSVAVIASSALRGRAGALAKAAARDIWLYDQRGCFSPQVFWVEKDPRDFAARLQRELDDLYRRHGPVKRPVEVAVERRIFLDRLEASAAAGRAVFAKRGPLSAGPVVYLPREGPLQGFVSGQVVAVREFRSPADIRRELGPLAPRLRCVGFAGSAAARHSLISALRFTALERICGLGEMQDPPIESVV